MTIIVPITDPKRREPTFPSNTFDGNLLNRQKAIIAPRNAAEGNMLEILSSYQDCKINVDSIIIESPD